MPDRCRICEPTVEHHVRGAVSVARCWRCGAVATAVPWDDTTPPADATERALAHFRQEIGHAD